MGFRRTAWIVALVVGWAAIVVTTPVVVHAVMAEKPAPATESEVAVQAGRVPQPRAVEAPVEGSTTTSSLPERTPQLDLGTTGRVPSPTPLAVAAPEDRSSWAKYLGPIAPMDVSEAEIAGAMYAWINEERAARGIAPLAWSADLAHSARWWTLEMVGYEAAHSNMLGKLPDRYSVTAENVGTVLPGDGALLHKALVNSPRHLSNVLDPRVDVVGIGVACAPDGRLYVTHHFGARRPDTPVEGRAPAWRSDPDASVARDGRRGPARCDGSWPASEDPPEATTAPPAEPETPTTTAPSTSTTSPGSSTSTTSSSTSTSTTSSTTTSTSSSSTTSSSSSTTSSTSSTSTTSSTTPPTTTTTTTSG